MSAFFSSRTFRAGSRVAAALVCVLPAGYLLASGGCNVKPYNGVASGGDAGLACPACPPDPTYTMSADCSMADAVDTLPIENFDGTHEVSIGSVGVPAAKDMYTYTDGTAAILVEAYTHDVVSLGAPNGSILGKPGGYVSTFEPPVAAGSPCGPSPDAGILNGVLHAFGGEFRAWGGGLGVSMAKLNGRDPITGNVDTSPNEDPLAPKDLCCAGGGPPCTPNPKYGSVCPPADAEFAVYIAAIDVSAYEGVSFWARRGPTSQAGLRVNVGDKYTDDDLNYLAQRQQVATGQPQPLHCQRVRECDCRLGQTCAFYNDGGPSYPPGTYCQQPVINVPNAYSFCGGQPPPDAGPMPISLTEGTNTGATIISGVGPSNCCDNLGCNAPYPAYPTDTVPLTGRFAGLTAPASMMGTAGQDPQFFGRPCTPFGWGNGVNGSFCFDPATDPPPAPSTELCGDHWMATVDLTTSWQFFMVPFTNLRQQGWAKRSEQLDLHSVSTVRFTWDVGFIDYWIDNVSFYRHKGS